MLALCSIRKEKRMDVKAGRRDIYTQVPAISSFNLFCWLTNTKRPNVHLVEPAGTSRIRALKMRISNRSEDSIRRWVLLWHHIRLLPLRPHASRS